jgi:hypothetical protein
VIKVFANSETGPRELASDELVEVGDVVRFEADSPAEGEVLRRRHALLAARGVPFSVGLLLQGASQ